MGQKCRSVSRVTEHKGMGGGGVQALTLGLLWDQTCFTLCFSFKLKALISVASTEIGNFIWRTYCRHTFYIILQWSLFWVYLTWFLKKGSAIFYHPFLHILLYKTILFHIWLYHGLKTTNSITTWDRAPITSNFKLWIKKIIKVNILQTI